MLVVAFFTIGKTGNSVDAHWQKYIYISSNLHYGILYRSEQECTTAVYVSVVNLRNFEWKKQVKRILRLWCQLV